MNYFVEYFRLIDLVALAALAALAYAALVFLTMQRRCDRARPGAP